MKNNISIWFTGLSGAGKTTLAQLFAKSLINRGLQVQVLDGDVVRDGLNRDLGFSETDRKENIRRVAEVSKLFSLNNIITINAFICPTNDLRDMALQIIGSENFKLVYIQATVEVCESRDVKGLYKKARKGEIPDFTGISAPFDVPVNPHLVIDTVNNSIEDCVLLLEKWFDSIN